MSSDKYFSCSEGENFLPPPTPTELAAYAVPRRRGRPLGCRAGRLIHAARAARAAVIARAPAASLPVDEREKLECLRSENRRLRERLQAAVETSSRLRDRVWRLQDEAALARRGPPPPATCRPPHPPRRHDQPPPPPPTSRIRQQSRPQQSRPQQSRPQQSRPQRYFDRAPSTARRQTPPPQSARSTLDQLVALHPLDDIIEI